MAGSSTTVGTSASYTMEEIKQHKKKNSVWIVINNNVYDVTMFLDEHPGGREELLDHAGKDATDDFDNVLHSYDAKQLMKKYFIGTVKPTEQTR